MIITHQKVLDRPAGTRCIPLYRGDLMTIRFRGEHREWWRGKFVDVNEYSIAIEPEASGIWGEWVRWPPGEGEHCLPLGLIASIVVDGVTP